MTLTKWPQYSSCAIHANMNRQQIGTHGLNNKIAIRKTSSDIMGNKQLQQRTPKMNLSTEISVCHQEKLSYKDVRVTKRQLRQDTRWVLTSKVKGENAHQDKRAKKHQA